MTRYMNQQVLGDFQHSISLERSFRLWLLGSSFYSSQPKPCGLQTFFGSLSRAHQVTLYSKKLKNHGQNSYLQNTDSFNPIKINQGFHRSSTIFEGLGICSSSKIDVSIHFQSRLDFQGKHAASNFFPLEGCENKPLSGCLLATVAKWVCLGLGSCCRVSIASQTVLPPVPAEGGKKTCFSWPNYSSNTPGKLIFWTQNWGLENDVPISSGWFWGEPAVNFPGCRWTK